MDRSKTMKGFDVGRSMDFCPLIRCTRSLTRNTSFPKMYNPLLHFRRKRDDVFYVNLLPSTKLKHSMIVFLQSLTLQKLPCDHIHVTGFDDLTQVCRVTQDQRIEMSVLDQIGRKDFPNWMQVVKHSLLGMHGYTLRYKLLCCCAYFHIFPNGMHMFCHFSQSCWLMLVHLFLWENLKICETFPGQGVWIIQRVWGSWRIFFGGWYPSIKGMKDQSTW